MTQIVPPPRSGRTTQAGTTKLSRRLHGHGTSEKPGPLQAFRVARRTFLAGEQIDMGGLAAEMGVDRATLYRWLGNRDQLVEEIIWSFAEPAWQRAVAASHQAGAAGVVDVARRWLESIAAPDAQYFRAYLRREPVRALRLLSTRDGLHQQRVIGLFEQLVVDRLVATGVDLPLPPRDLAYVMTRLAESFLYSDLITGETPDVSKAAAAIGAILGVPNAAPQKTTQRGGRSQ